MDEDFLRRGGADGYQQMIMIDILNAPTEEAKKYYINEYAEKLAERIKKLIENPDKFSQDKAKILQGDLEDFKNKFGVK